MSCAARISSEVFLTLFKDGLVLDFVACGVTAEDGLRAISNLALPLGINRARERFHATGTGTDAIVLALSKPSAVPAVLQLEQLWFAKCAWMKDQCTVGGHVKKPHLAVELMSHSLAKM